LNYRSLVRVIITAGALGAGVMLAGCNSDEIALATNSKANQPVPPKLIAAIAEKDMDLQSPILVRLFKQEAELEVWKQDRSGRFALLKTYPICRWSGDLGPKVREGDRQAPEGFYSISPGQMNPQSAYYLSFNTGYPNAFDRALGRSGSQLMVHGDCSSRGCYAMTDEQIAEIYALGRESFFGGQKAFQLQAYPFRMTPMNMAKHRNNPNMAFWKMIKEGYDHFEVTRQEPKVDFCEKKYVFDAAKPPNAPRDPVFDASAKCPAYVVPDEVASAVRERQQQEEAEVAKLIERGTPVAKLKTGIDGGMNQVFAARVPGGNTGLSEGGEGQGLALAGFTPAPGTVPSTVNPPRDPGADEAAAALATTWTAPAPPAPSRVAASTPSSSTASNSSSAPSGGFFADFARKVGLGAGSDTTASTASAAPAKPKMADAKRGEPPRPEAWTPKTAAASKPVEVKQEPKQETKQVAAARPAPKPQLSETPADPAPPARDTLVAGAQPIVSSSSFESRFSAAK
jgi:murein L,D-transpeptidase YafK